MQNNKLYISKTNYKFMKFHKNLKIIYSPYGHFVTNNHFEDFYIRSFSNNFFFGKILPNVSAFLLNYPYFLPKFLPVFFLFLPKLIKTAIIEFPLKFILNNPIFFMDQNLFYFELWLLIISTVLLSSPTILLNQSSAELPN